MVHCRLPVQQCATLVVTICTLPGGGFNHMCVTSLRELQTLSWVDPQMGQYKMVASGWAEVLHDAGSTGGGGQSASGCLQYKDKLHCCSL